MAVDYGDARTGLAVSDETASITGDAWVIHNNNEHGISSMIVSEAVTRNVGKIIIGHPKNMNGTVGPRAEKSERLAGLVRALCDIEVLLWDERMTTISAHQVLTETGRFGKKRKKKVDAVAASLILENYLAYLKSTRS